MTIPKKREETAYERATILSPLFDPDLDRAAHAQLLKQIAETQNLSTRTLRRWLKVYREEGFTGLLPKERSFQGERVIPETVVDQAVLLRREVPQRSVNDIIRLLELEQRIPAGSVKRSTLQDQLERRGYGARQLAMYYSSGTAAARRFEYKERNGLWQADIKYLLVLPATAKRPATQLYVSAFLDDASRLVTGCRVYAKQDVHCVLDCFRYALETYGVPDRLFTDNGKQYVSKELKQTCAKLGITLLRARPYAAQAKGKIESFNRLLEKFVAEEKLEHPSSVEQVQHDLDCWLERFYYTMPHSALKGKTPRQAFNEQTTALRFVDEESLNFAFRSTETRLVNKSGCLSFRGQEWEAGSAYIGLKVEVSFQANAPDELTIYHELMEPKQIRVLTMTSHTRKEKTPIGIATSGSRILVQARKNPPELTGSTFFRDMMEKEQKNHG